MQGGDENTCICLLSRLWCPVLHLVQKTGRLGLLARLRPEGHDVEVDRQYLIITTMMDYCAIIRRNCLLTILQ